MAHSCRFRPPFRSGAAVKGQAHDNGVPQLTAGSPVLPGPAPFLDEAGLAVQGDRGRIVREYLKAELVEPLAARPADGRLDERRTDPAAPPAAVDQHPELTEAVPAGLDVQHPDELAVGHGDDRTIGGPGELRGALVDVDRRLGRDSGALPGYGGEKLRHRPGIPGLRGPDRELRHPHMLSFPVTTTLAAFGPGGCAARVAQAYGEHPETAAPRMSWACATVARAAAASPEPARVTGTRPLRQSATCRAA
jgi:hypothetical protein